MYKIVIASTLAIVLATAATALWWERLIKDLEWRYSDLDPTRIRKAYRAFMTDALTGKHADIDDADDREMEKRFLLYYDRTA